MLHEKHPNQGTKARENLAQRGPDVTTGRSLPRCEHSSGALQSALHNVADSDCISNLSSDVCAMFLSNLGAQ